MTDFQNFYTVTFGGEFLLHVNGIFPGNMI